VLLEDALGLDVLLTQDVAVFEQSTVPKLNYSLKMLGAGLNMKPQGILFEFGIKDYAIEVSQDPRFHKVFFRNKEGDIPFDLFGAAFWLLTRYEEYLPHKSDAYERFHYKSSLAYQYGFLETALVNVWLLEFKKILKDSYSQFNFVERVFSFVSTIDIDNAYKFKFKGVVRTMAGYVLDVFRGNIKNLQERTAIILGKKKDPFDCYGFLIDAHLSHEVKTIFFFLVGDYGVNDKNHSANNLGFQTLIKHLSDYSEVGIHPSFGSNGVLQQLKVELNRLAKITHKPIYRSRQHFSMLKFPLTYQYLLQAGISEDYSMGYTNMNGFRASYCYPYTWYNIEEESNTSLKIYPFALSENTADYYSSKENKNFMELLNPIVDEVKKYNGLLISVFHNNTFSPAMRKNYLDFLAKVRGD
jgi:hypothetical protein